MELLPAVVFGCRPVTVSVAGANGMALGLLYFSPSGELGAVRWIAESVAGALWNHTLPAGTDIEAHRTWNVRKRYVVGRDHRHSGWLFHSGGELLPFGSRVCSSNWCVVLVRDEIEALRGWEMLAGVADIVAVPFGVRCDLERFCGAYDVVVSVGVPFEGATVTSDEIPTLDEIGYYLRKHNVAKLRHQTLETLHTAAIETYQRSIGKYVRDGYGAFVEATRGDTVGVLSLTSQRWLRRVFSGWSLQLLLQPF
ncbi:MAG: hypothetical protein N3B17_03655 [Chlorobi bacterium]|nr:hypothetical protein [Chlorobiota bacterium]